MNLEQALEHARDVLRHEAAAVESLIARIAPETFGRALELLLGCQGLVVVTGMGKAFQIGQKISATLASTGTPSLPLHAGEALHGDLGRVRPQDVAIVLSNSGRTRECVELLPPLKRLCVPVVAITGNPDSPLGQNADVVLDIGNLDEACPLGLAPSTTTTAMLALGDALALSALQQRAFGPEDFALFHPAGSLGRKLMKVEEVMRRGERNPVVSQDEPLLAALTRITKAKAGAVSVVDGEGKLVGVFTDGDVRRHVMKGTDFSALRLADAMTKNPLSIRVGRLASEAAGVLRERSVDELPVVDAQGQPVGMVDIQDVLGTSL
ncbi:MAG: KpsF/GutQ family sugar-phosphate isomerase [Planctomycetota bacterium]